MTRSRPSYERISHKQRLRAAHIGEILDREIPHPEIPLIHEDPFTLLCAVLLSAQCTDVRVNQVMPQLKALGRTAKDLAQVPLELIEEAIRTCGLYRAKAKALKALSQQLMELNQGQVPCDLEALERLPGVGHKTASVVMVQAFGVPAFPVDTHIARSAKRWGLSPTDEVGQVERILKKLFPEELWGRRHLQIVLFARKFCPARSHVEEQCPICSKLGSADPSE